MIAAVRGRRALAPSTRVLPPFPKADALSNCMNRMLPNPENTEMRGGSFAKENGMNLTSEDGNNSYSGASNATDDIAGASTLGPSFFVYYRL